MFVHVAKDFMKKLDDLESRLSISMDKDEIHTLGLKLRFYHNEIKNYLSRMQQIHDRIIEIQRKYGFKPEEQALPPSAPPLERTFEERPATAPPPPLLQNDTQDAIKLLADWVMKLQKQGFSPQEALARARDYIREGAKPTGINITLPEESAASLNQAAADIADRQPPPEAGSTRHQETPHAEITAQTPAEPDDPAEPEQRIDEHQEPLGAAEESPAKDSAKNTFEETLDAVEQHNAVRNPMDNRDAAPVAPEPKSDDVDLDSETAVPEFSQQPNRSDDIIPAKERDVPEAEPAAKREPQARPRDAELDLLPLLERWGQDTTPEQLPDNFANRLETLINSRRGEILMALEDLGQSQKMENGNKNGLSGFVLFCLGYFAHRLGREGLAITTMERSLNMGCVYSLSYLVLGRCYQEKRIYEKALIHFKFADKLDPSIEQARLGIANALLFLNRYEQALDYLANQSFDIEENQVESILLQSSALEKLGRLPVAVDLLEQTVESCRSISCTAACLFRLGKIKENQKDVLKAIDLFEETVESDPDHLEARYTLGRLYMAHKAVPLARKHLLFLTRNYPDSKWADKAREIT